MGPYCKLCNVTDDSRYYDSDTSTCLLCEGNAAAPLALFIVGVAILALLVGAFFRFRPDLNIAKLAKLSARARTLSTQLSLRAKIKQSVTMAHTLPPQALPPPSCHRVIVVGYGSAPMAQASCSASYEPSEAVMMP